MTSAVVPSKEQTIYLISSTNFLVGWQSSQEASKTPFDKQGSTNIELVPELDGIRTSRNLESSSACRYWRLRQCGFAGRTKEIGSGYLTNWSRVLSTSFLEKHEQNGNTVSLHSMRCDIRLPSARSRIRSVLKRDDNHGET